jgi:hypothetical protein
VACGQARVGGVLGDDHLVHFDTDGAMLSDADAALLQSQLISPGFSSDLLTVSSSNGTTWTPFAAGDLS